MEQSNGLLVVAQVKVAIRNDASVGSSKSIQESYEGAEETTAYVPWEYFAFRHEPPLPSTHTLIRIARYTKEQAMTKYRRRKQIEAPWTIKATIITFTIASKKQLQGRELAWGCPFQSVQPLSIHPGQINDHSFTWNLHVLPRSLVIAFARAFANALSARLLTYLPQIVVELSSEALREQLHTINANRMDWLGLLIHRVSWTSLQPTAQSRRGTLRILAFRTKLTKTVAAPSRASLRLERGHIGASPRWTRPPRFGVQPSESSDLFN